ncbi:MAG: undecaprenyl-diphosphatase UppP [Firmicutes bacterium]|nr:undecaprenyl-diphosphatase UppP [Bacillota bacterium]
MTMWQAVLLGITQGVTEFFPVSSSGHLVIARHLLGASDYALTFDVMVHLGSLAAVAVYFRGDLVRMAAGVLGGQGAGAAEGRRLFWLLVMATVPLAVAGLLFRDAVAAVFGSVRVTALMLILTGALLLFADRATFGQRKGEPGWRQALAMGLAQAMAVLPGLSRSGVTIGAGVLSGLERQAAARFAFLMAVPAILGAAAVEAAGLWAEGLFSNGDLRILAAGAAAAAVSSYTAIAAFVRFVARGRLAPFAYYTWAVAAIILLLSMRPA